MSAQNGYAMGSQQSLNMYGQQPGPPQQHFNRQNYEFHQMPQQQQQQQEQLAQQQRRNQLRGCGTGSVTSIHSLQNGESLIV